MRSQSVATRARANTPGTDRAIVPAPRAAHTVLRQPKLARAVASSGSLDADFAAIPLHTKGERSAAGKRGWPDREVAGKLGDAVTRSETPVVRRDLATPPPATPAAAQPDLTPAQIQAALRFNRARYDAARTRLIQDLAGTTPTGVWSEQDVVAIAGLQEEFGLAKDGRVGETTFRFLDREVQHEGIPHTDAHCLLSFQVRNFGVTDAGVAGGLRNVRGHFEVDTQFSQTCGCADYEYRQFIRGHARRLPAGGGAPVDLGPLFSIPGGRLPAGFVEDGDTSPGAVLNYGHRDQPAEPINRYLDDAGAEDQPAGCRYRNQDFPGGRFPFAAGDRLDLDINFRGEVRRRGRVVQTKFWSAIRNVFG